MMHQYRIQPQPQQQMVLRPQHAHVAAPGGVVPQPGRQQVPGFQLQLQQHGGMRVVRPLQPGAAVSRQMPPPRRP